MTMQFTSKLTRTKALALFTLVAAACGALSAPHLFGPSHAAAREEGSPIEAVQVYAGDCVTPQTVFYLGDVVCVSAGGFPAPPDAAEYYRRISYAAPNLNVVETTTVSNDPQFDRFRIPDTGDFALPGTWRVHAVDIETNARADAKFTVRHPLTRYTDLNVWKVGPDVVLPGDKVIYQLAVKNNGPDSAISIELAEEVPTNAYFYGLRQTGGSLFDCKTPSQWERGQIYCYGRGLKPGESATFDVYYVIDKYAREGDTCEGATKATSSTEELHAPDNATLYAANIGGPDPGEQPPPEEP